MAIDGYNCQKIIVHQKESPQFSQKLSVATLARFRLFPCLLISENLWGEPKIIIHTKIFFTGRFWLAVQCILEFIMYIKAYFTETKNHF